MTPKLTILVPSYNGESHIKTTIESLILERETAKETEVEILVCVNGSIDGTRELIEREFTDSLNIKVVYFETNLGYDRNILRAIEMADSEFIWFVGDDDVVLRGSVRTIINELNENPMVSVVLLEPYFFTYDSEISSFAVNPELARFDNRLDYFSKVKWNGSALSSIIIRRPDQSTLQEVQKHSGANWIHLVILFDRVFSEPSEQSQLYSFASKGMVAVRMLNPRWKDNFGNYVVVGLDHMELLRKILRPRDKALYKIYFDLRKKTNWSDVKTGYKDIDRKNRNRFIKLQIRFFWKYPTFWILTFPVLLSPEFIRSSVIRIQEYCFIRANKMLKRLMSDSVRS